MIELAAEQTRGGEDGMIARVQPSNDPEHKAPSPGPTPNRGLLSIGLTGSASSDGAHRLTKALARCAGRRWIACRRSAVVHSNVAITVERICRFGRR